MTRHRKSIADDLEGLDGWLFDDRRPHCDLRRLDPAARPFASGDKEADERRLEALAVELDELQNLFYADRRYKMLIVLQGLDTSGKDGTLRHVFSRMSPLGVRVAPWKAPAGAELEHDYLWRIHQKVPALGEVTAFNRSHYEDVLVPAVAGQLTGKALAQRHAHINDFERMLCETGTVIVKFMLHISKDEQRERLQARLDEPAKRWKFDPQDLETRRQWRAYERAYSKAISATSTRWAPWIVVPADSKTHRNLMVATVLRETFRRLKLRFPPPPKELEHIVVE